jgi:methylmalonyl-CoA mutase
MCDFLFDEFSNVSEKQWKQKIQYDLNGADYNQLLLSHFNDDITVKPFYHLDTYSQLKLSKNKTDFKICQSIFIDDSKIANGIAQNAIEKGAASILFKASKPFEINIVLKRIHKETELQFDLTFLSKNFIEELILKTKEYKTYLNIDLVGNLCKTGNWHHSIQKDFEIFEAINNKVSEHQPTVAGINVSQYQNSGANSIQQVAYALAHGNEYLNREIASLHINAKFSIGSNYFFEIAKLRAFRYLWNLITKDAGIKSNLHITTIPSTRNKTLYSYNTNMIRTTSECMSAILGGSNTVCNLSYDSIFHKSNEFGERIARNQSLILENESSFKKTQLAADGSYYIESLTKEIAQKSLILFKNIEKNGGFLKQLKLGTIQRKINESAEKEQELFDTGKLVLIGSNKYEGSIDKMKGELELYPFLKTNPRKTLIQPIISKRLTEKIELERLKNES